MTHFRIGAAALAILATLLIACGGEDSKEELKSTASQPAASLDGADVYTLDPANSSFRWKGSKLYETSFHEGAVDLQSAKLGWKDGAPVGGEIVVDMTSIKNTDISDQEMNAKITGHLKSPDFFNVSEYPAAKFEIVSAEPAGENQYRITGNLTIKDISHEVESVATFTESEEGVRGRSTVVLDRTKYGVRYGSENYFMDLAQDEVIDDKIELTMDLAFQK